VPTGVRLEFDQTARDRQMQLAAQTGQVVPQVAASETPVIDFQPSGRTDPAAILVYDRGNKVTRVECPSATETFRIVPPQPK